MGTMSVMALTKTLDSLPETEKKISAGLLRWPSCLPTPVWCALPASFLLLQRWTDLALYTVPTHSTRPLKPPGKGVGRGGGERWRGWGGEQFAKECETFNFPCFFFLPSLAPSFPLFNIGYVKSRPSFPDARAPVDINPSTMVRFTWPELKGRNN